jgi:type II secretory pathway pseudopilin PulG
MIVLNWTGLVVNGLVAFLLPMYLVLRSSLHKTQRRAQQHEQEQKWLQQQQQQQQVYRSGGLNNVELVPVLSNNTRGNSLNNANYAATQTGSNGSETPYTTLDFADDDDIDDVAIKPLPFWMEPARNYIVIFMITCFSVIIGGTILLDIVTGVQPEE